MDIVLHKFEDDNIIPASDKENKTQGKVFVRPNTAKLIFTAFNDGEKVSVHS